MSDGKSTKRGKERGYGGGCKWYKRLCMGTMNNGMSTERGMKGGEGRAGRWHGGSVGKMNNRKSTGSGRKRKGM